MHIISLSQYSHHPTVLISTSSPCPQYSIVHQCYQIISLNSVQHLSSALSCTSSRCLNTAYFHSATKYIISLSSVQHLPKLLSCNSSHCPQYSICHQCSHAYHLAVSVRHLSSMQTCTSSHCLSTASFSSAIMHIIPLSSVKKCFTSATMHITSLSVISTVIFQQCHRVYHLNVSLQHLSSVLICTSSRYPQYVNLSSVLPTSSRCLNTASFHSATMRIISLSSVQHRSTIQPCISSHCPQYSIFHWCIHAYHLAVSDRNLSSVLQCTSSHYFSTASFSSAHKSSRRPQYSIVQQCQHALYATTIPQCDYRIL